MTVERVDPSAFEAVQVVVPECSICDRGFTVREWRDRHDAVDGPCHEVCCPDADCGVDRG